MRGITEVEGLHIDKWKDRVWNLIENAGLLPEYNDEETTEMVEILDTWYTSED
jgi:sulfur transfer protein SufE